MYFSIQPGPQPLDSCSSPLPGPLRQVTLTSLTETGQDESTIPVLKQRSYTGPEVLPSALADTPCADLGIERVLMELNTTLGTSYTLHSTSSVLVPYITQGFDFGTAYAHLRPHWENISTLEHELSTREEKDGEMRRSVLANDRITMRDVPPRRLWDLCANRVVPYWVACDEVEPSAISHAWVAAQDREYVMTSINGCEWPVPMPKGVKLELIRIEMLNVRSNRTPRLVRDYVWLDVLCLRQEGGKSKELLLDEWKLDVPTIGSMYQRIYPPVVYYFNGLGRPLHLLPGYFESDRCWFRRAWTLQELIQEPIIAGETGEDIIDEQLQMTFDRQLESSHRSFASILHLVSEMRHRDSTMPLDKVAGLVYPLAPTFIPVYDPNQSPEDAWEVLMDVIDPSFRAELFFTYPAPGNGRKYWRPSWEQVLTNKIMARTVFMHVKVETVVWSDNSDADCYDCRYIMRGNVRDLGEVPNEPTPRQGK
ncbi:hypothetical protein IW261DRAFT_1484026 [Armillaria novae-zelandiae]|uniref:Heterokaryon incompatibility domain-containing protein n=1 Tax=Armillaria novae-zelandiae TaxID=153914 RepID=A0AA39P5Z9_9AGAR|nr:hypothetical protein IW261DRAFT_1484026 [Armillaria novae-zelandiae]